MSTVVKLIGVHIEDPKIAERFLNDLVMGKKVIIEPDEESPNNPQSVYVYVWGLDKKKLPSYIDISKFEYKGFLDVKYSASGGTRKGLSLFLNATMIKAGLVKVDTAQDFSLKEQFLKLQEKAQRNKIGLWGAR